MEEPQPPMNSVDERSAKTAEMLRAMRDQTDKALDAHRRRIEDLEAELTRRIQQITEELVHVPEADEAESAAVNKLREGLRTSQEALHKAEIEITALRGQLAAQSSDQEAEIAARAEQLQQLLADRDQEAQERARLAEQSRQFQAERDQLLHERTSLSEELGQVLTDQLKSSEEIVQLAEQVEQLHEDLNHASRERSQLAEELEQLQENLDETSRERNQLTTQWEQIQEERDQARQGRNLLAEELQKVQVERDQVAEERGRQADELEQLRTEHAGLATQREQLTGEAASLREVLAAADQRHMEAQQQMQKLEAQLQAQRQEHAQVSQELAESLAAGAEATNELTKNEQLVVELHEEIELQKGTYEAQLGELKENLEQTHRKCELALADVHKLKRTNAELHEELVRRPETDDRESPELVSLRAERDALAARVEELESAAVPQRDEDSQQEMADMQRRFEMAVEDVRHLKRENAALREQLEASPETKIEASKSDGMDWQAQKARLLAALDAEDTGKATPQRREERTTIEGTISITDRVVCEKDREIAELRVQLEARPAGATAAEKQSESDREEAIRAAHEELFSNDEVIQTERGRLTQLQHEWKEKLRTAELEISVQRATLARDHAKLEEKLAYLQSQTAELATADGKPKRRWLSALGLNEDKSD